MNKVWSRAPHANISHILADNVNFVTACGAKIPNDSGTRFYATQPKWPTCSVCVLRTPLSPKYESVYRWKPIVSGYTGDETPGTAAYLKRIVALLSDAQGRANGDLGEGVNDMINAAKIMLIDAAECTPG